MFSPLDLSGLCTHLIIYLSPIFVIASSYDNKMAVSLDVQGGDWFRVCVISVGQSRWL